MIRCLSLLAVCSLLACSSSISIVDAGNSDSGTDAGPPPSDAGADGGSDAGNTADAGVMGGGVVSFSAGTPGVQGDLFQIVAVFAEGTSTTGSNLCSPAGACQYCPSLAADAGLPVLHFQGVSAGGLTFNDGNNNLATLGDDAGVGLYTANSGNAPALTWNPGDDLSISASGSTIPAFSASLVAPKLISGFSPALNLLNPISISLSQPFAISWTPSGDSGATMVLVLGDDGAGHGTVSCTVPESAGTVSVAASLLTSYTRGDTGTAQLTRTVTDNVDAGPFPIIINANAPSVVGTVSYTP